MIHASIFRNKLLLAASLLFAFVFSLPLASALASGCTGLEPTSEGGTGHTNVGNCNGGGGGGGGPAVYIPVMSISVNPTTINQGGSATLSWSCSEAMGANDYVGMTSNNFGGSGNSGSMTVSPSQTTTYTATCSSSSSSQTQSATLTVNAAYPDVSAGGTSPSSATTASPVTFSSTISNTGNATATNFPNSFQISGIGYVAAQTHTLGAGGSAAISGNYTFTAAGSYSVRACADTNTSGSGAISEPNEDNCGSWTTVTVSDPVPAAPGGLSAVCNAAGTSVTFSWNPVTYATGYYFRNDDQQISSCGSWYCQDPPDTMTAPIAQTSYTVNGTVPGHVNSWWVHSNNAAGYSAATWSSITCSGQANLTPGSVYAGGAVTAGVATTLYSNTYNAGTGATGGNSVTAFQRANDAAGTGAVTIGFYTVGNIAAAGQQQASTGYTFPSAATWYMRTCVDWNGQITESDEGNCGSWEAFSVGAPLPVCSNGIDDDGDGATDYPADSGCSAADDTTDGPNLPTATLSANPTTISTTPPNNVSTLTWGSSGSGVTSCTGSGFTAGGSSGTRSVSPTTPGANTYGVYCTNASGNSPTVYATVTVITPSASITAQPTSVDARGAGGSTNLLWSALDATTCDIDRSQGSPSKVLDNAIPNGTTTTAVSSITRQTRFTLTCDTASGNQVTSFVTVNPIPTSSEF